MKAKALLSLKLLVVLSMLTLSGCSSSCSGSASSDGHVAGCGKSFRF
ncbi:MAG: hypothetical protein HQL70_00810 [Magnetococcales bacterium]|nr:hypothetical protein [Magnetococcales bacterium]